MSKLINLEVIAIEDFYAVLESENGIQMDIHLSLLPENLKEGRCLKFVISHTAYNMNEEYEQPTENNLKNIPAPNGRQLSY